VDGLRRWFEACEWQAEPYPWTRVFHRDFSEEFLLGRCHSGGPLNPEDLASLAAASGPNGARDLTGDIKLPWEFSRGYAFVLQAAGTPSGRRETAAAEIAEKIVLWEEHNRDLGGPNWICAMEVALRAVNWACADALLEGGVSERVGRDRWLDGLWTAGQVVEQRIEARKVSSNHYLADLLGLAVIGLHFPATADGRRWRRFGVAEMQKALLRQTYRDGGLYESSLPYHALVTEMALLLALFARESLRPAFLRRLERMARVVAACLDAGGDVFPIGDEDGGRVIPLDFISRRGRGEILLQLAEQVFPGADFSRPSEAFFPRSGWWVRRRGDFEVCLEFGGYGPCGYGSHAHNDTLSVVINFRGSRLFVDPGTYLYTPDPEARNRFRSAAAHNALTRGGREPWPLPTDMPGLFRLPGPDRPGRVTEQDRSGIRVETTTGGTFRCSRRVQVEADRVILDDRWSKAGGEPLTWNFTLAPGVLAERDGAAGFRLVAPSGVLRLACSRPEAEGRVEDGEMSPGYGRREKVQRLRVRLAGGMPEECLWTLSPEQPPRPG